MNKHPGLGCLQQPPGTRDPTAHPLIVQFINQHFGSVFDECPGYVLENICADAQCRSVTAGTVLWSEVDPPGELVWGLVDCSVDITFPKRVALSRVLESKTALARAPPTVREAAEKLRKGARDEQQAETPSGQREEVPAIHPNIEAACAATSDPVFPILLSGAK